jgi:hypothetical protein
MRILVSSLSPTLLRTIAVGYETDISAIVFVPDVPLNAFAMNARPSPSWSVPKAFELVSGVCFRTVRLVYQVSLAVHATIYSRSLHLVAIAGVRGIQRAR